DREQPRELAIDRDVDHGRAVAAQPRGIRGERCDVDADLPEIIRVAEYNRLAVQLAGCALAGRRVEPLHRTQLEPALVRLPDDRIRQRMLARSLDARGKLQDVVFLK